ncbi:MAG TPA: radical SAM protein [Anaerolineae bacterium]|nr:radical SAM protein [Anaerolineae bacterium]
MTNTGSTLWAEVDERGRLVLPAEVAARYGLKPGTRARIEPNTNHLRLHRPVTHLAKVYVEPTSLCNIACRTCIRNVWDEPMGMMSAATFERIVEDLSALTPASTVFFGGLGEPLFHPRIVEMVTRVKAIGAPAELITNGTLLDEERARQLIESGLDVLWVSIDGATPESYGDVRLGAALPEVLDNLARFRQLRPGSHRPKPQIGIAFVALKRNIAELPEVIALGRRLGASRFMVSNVLPYTPEMYQEILYGRALTDIAYISSPWLPHLSLPKMEMSEFTQVAFRGALRSGCNVTFAGNNLGGANDACAFVEGGSTSIGWDGSVSPCLSLLHSHVTYLNGRQRHMRRHVMGNVTERRLLDVWSDPSYVAYRQRVQGFAFAPCTFCGGCELIEGNEEDCLGNTFPACGGCLWAQGIIQCP